MTTNNTTTANLEAYRAGYIDGYVAHGGNYYDLSGEKGDAEVQAGFDQHFGDESDR